MNPLVVDSKVRVDTDTGCDVAPACLSCPLPRCIHDLTVAELGEQRRQRKAQPILEVLALLTHLPPEEAARQAAASCGVGIRTVFRIKARNKEEYGLRTMETDAMARVRRVRP